MGVMALGLVLCSPNPLSLLPDVRDPSSRTFRRLPAVAFVPGEPLGNRGPRRTPAVLAQDGCHSSGPFGVRRNTTVLLRGY